MECKKEQNLKHCTCTEASCPKSGICCECIKYHRNNDELPGCYFTKEAEATYDRSIEHFIKIWQENHK